MGLNAHELAFLATWESQTDLPLIHSSLAQRYPWKNTGRQFRTDFVFPQGLTYIEIDGAVFGVGGHSTGVGITKDRLKDAIAASRGWACVRIPTTNVDEMVPLAIEICHKRLAMMEALESIGFEF